MSEPVGNSPRGNIPGNSHKDREELKKPAESREKVEKIVEGKVVTRKKPWYKRAAQNIVVDDAQSIGEYILSDVLLPAAKNMLYDIISQGANRALFGSSKNLRGGRGGGGPVSSLRHKYEDYSAGEPRRMMSRESRATHDFREVILNTRAEAVAVVEDLIFRVDKFGSASVADLYDLVGVTGSFADQRWGWTDLSRADVTQVREGFLLDLPRPEHIK